MPSVVYLLDSIYGVLLFFSFSLSLPLSLCSSVPFPLPHTKKKYKKSSVPTHRLTRPKAVLDVALEDDAIGLGEAEGLVH